MTRQEWQARFQAAWSAETKFFGPDSDNYEDDPDFDYTPYLNYRGIDYTVSNQGYDPSKNEYWFGAPYRKEVTPDDNMGTYQRSSLTMKDGVVTATILLYPDSRLGRLGFWTPTEKDWTFTKLVLGLDVYEHFPDDPEAAAGNFEHETHLNY